MAFPTSSFTPAENADDVTGTQNLTVTVPSSCQTLIVFVSDPGKRLITAVAWDTAGVNQAITRQGDTQDGTGWGSAGIWILKNPVPGTSKNLRVTQTTANQIGVTIVGFDEPVEIVSNGGAPFSSPAGTGGFDCTISSITTVAGDVVISSWSDDGGTNELAAPGPLHTTGTIYQRQANGGGDSWSGSGVTNASGSSTTITWNYPSQAIGGWGDAGLKYVVLRDATPPPVVSPIRPLGEGLIDVGAPLGPYAWLTPLAWF